MDGQGNDAGASSRRFDRPPRHGVAPPADETLARSILERAPHPDEFDGPDDIWSEESGPEIERAVLPPVTWAADKDAPDYAHLSAPDTLRAAGVTRFTFTADDLDRLIAANRFAPEGPDGLVVFALRGAQLVDRSDGHDDGIVDMAEAITLEETRPDHRNFRCVIGFFHAATRKLTAFRASTVPNVAFMTNFYRWNHGLGGNPSTSANMLPTGCYVFRIGVHKGRIFPALRLTDWQERLEDGVATVLRTKDDLTFKSTDVWHKTQPYDHVHCAYADDSFSSAGCLTVQGADGHGPWGRFQSVLKRSKVNTRLDLVLLTGREAAIAARLREKGEAKDGPESLRRLCRLRPGSTGPSVSLLQERLALEPSGYFGPETKKALLERQAKEDVTCDGVWSPALDDKLGWNILELPDSPVDDRSEPAAVVATLEPSPAPAPMPVAHPPALPPVQPPVLDAAPAPKPEVPAKPDVEPEPAPLPEPKPIASSTPEPPSVEEPEPEPEPAATRAPKTAWYDAPPRDSIELTPEEAERAAVPRAPDPAELLGPDHPLPRDLDSPRATKLPPIEWPADDKLSPDYAHLVPSEGERALGAKQFKLTGADVERLLRANRFEPKGPDGRFVIAIRGANLLEAKSGWVAEADSLALEETRPDHRNFRCVIGFYNPGTRKFSAARASTVPYAANMTNFYLWSHKLGGDRSKGQVNLLPTGCYVFRVGPHGGGSIFPALRLTDPQKFSADGAATVLRSRENMTFTVGDEWDNCVTQDHVHCAYYMDRFDSSGCLTVQGTKHGEGPWGQFQAALKRLSRTARIDLVLMTGREAAIAAHLGSPDADIDEVRQLRRLRPGSTGEAVSRLQDKLGVKPSGYFGPDTKEKLIELQRAKGLIVDGIFSPALDAKLGWNIFEPAAPVTASQPTPSAQPTPAIQPAPTPQPAPAASPAPSPAPSAPVVAAADTNLTDQKPPQQTPEQPPAKPAEPEKPAITVASVAPAAEPAALPPAAKPEPQPDKPAASETAAPAAPAAAPPEARQLPPKVPVPDPLPAGETLVPAQPFPFKLPSAAATAASIPPARSTSPVLPVKPAAMSSLPTPPAPPPEIPASQRPLLATPPAPPPSRPLAPVPVASSVPAAAAQNRSAEPGSPAASLAGDNPRATLERIPSVAAATKGTLTDALAAAGPPAAAIANAAALRPAPSLAPATVTPPSVPRLDLPRPAAVVASPPAAPAEKPASEASLAAVAKSVEKPAEKPTAEGAATPPQSKPAPVAPFPAPPSPPPPASAPAATAVPAAAVTPAAPASPVRLVVTPETLAAFAPSALIQYRDALIGGADALTRSGINQTPLRFCHFLAQIRCESAGFKLLEEGMAFSSAARIRATWPARFPTLAAAEPYVNEPQKLAEKVYGDRFENRPGDGWRYRGRGLLQITGRAAYRDLGRRLGIPLEEHPELALDPRQALAIAAEAWTMRHLEGERDLNHLADANKLEAITWRLLGAYAGVEERRAAFEDAWRIWCSGQPPRQIIEPGVVERGDRGGRVEELNLRLKQMGLFAGIARDPPQHVFSQATCRAVQALQARFGLLETGVAGPETWAEIEKALERPASGALVPVATPREVILPPLPAERPQRAGRGLLWFRAWSIGLAVLALAFLVAFVFALATHDRDPEDVTWKWLPVLFGFGVFVAGLVQWLITRRRPGATAEPRTHEFEKMMRALPKPHAPPAPEEPVREGING